MLHHGDLGSVPSTVKDQLMYLFGCFGRLEWPSAVPPETARLHLPAHLRPSCPELMTRLEWVPSPKQMSTWWAPTVESLLVRVPLNIRHVNGCTLSCVQTDLHLLLGEDGPSQMALEDLAMFRAIPTCAVFYPSDAVSTERAVELAANTKVGCLGQLRLFC